MELDPEPTAVVVVDMQNGFCHPDGSLFAPGSESAIEPLPDSSPRPRRRRAVVYTRDVHPPDQFDGTHYYDEFDRWGEHVVEGTREPPSTATSTCATRTSSSRSTPTTRSTGRSWRAGSTATAWTTCYLRHARERLRAPHCRERWPA